jgi:hypothetical protein
MRTTLTPRPAVAAAAAVMALTGLLLLPAAGLALEADDAARASQATPDCEPLVTFTTAGTSGDARAVAITAQALERGVEGWSMVAWEVAEGTGVSSLTIVTTDGRSETRTEGIERGSADDVRELRFCGPAGSSGSDEAPATADGDAAGTGDEGSGDAEAGAGGAEAETADPAPNGAGSARPAQGAGDDETTRGDGAASGSLSPAPDESADEPEDGDASALAAADESQRSGRTDGEGGGAAAADGATGGDDAPAADGEIETEVLGVQLARTGGEVGPLLLWGMAGLAAGGVVLLTARRRDREGRQS